MSSMSGVQLVSVARDIHEHSITGMAREGKLGHLGKVCSWLKEEEPFLSVEEEAKLSGRAAIV